MNKQAHLGSWEMMRLRHGITLRVIDQLNDEQLKSHPIAGMRTPIELLVHMYHGTQQMASTVLAGAMPESTEKADVATITNKAQLLAYVNAAWKKANDAAQALTDAQLNALIQTPWGEPFPGFAIVGFIHDEYLHHRGQLYAYVRVFGIEPVMMWDFDNNAPEFQKQAAKA